MAKKKKKNERNERRSKKTKKGKKKQRNKCNFGVRRPHFDFIIKFKVLQSFSHFLICDYNFKKLTILYLQTTFI
jgi:hypothetical protein